MKEILQGTHLNKVFRDGDRLVAAVSDVSFTLQEGEFLGIVGESGCGKSTLLRLVSGLMKPDSGELLHNGEAYTGMSPAKTGRFLQMIFQDAYASFDPHMRMHRSILEAAPKNVSEEELVQLLDDLYLEAKLLEKRPGELSGGQCQRMSIARAILSGADILLCDEITSALDVVTEAQIVSLLQGIRQKREFSMMFVSHNIALVSQLCDRMIVMHDGQVAEEGSTKELLENPGQEYTKKLIASSRMQSL